MGCIYRIYCAENGKCYIGQSCQNSPARRYTRHWNDAINRNEDTPLYRAFRKYGRGAFSVETLCVVGVDSLDNMECYFAEQYNSYVWESGYNAILCGKGCQRNKHHREEHKQKMSIKMTGRKLSEETKQKLSEARKGKSCNWSDETRARVSETSRQNATGVKHSAETREKISQATKGRVGWAKGIPKSEETKEKLRVARTGILHTEETKQRLSEAQKQRVNARPETVRRKFTDEQVRAVRQNLDNLTQKQLAEQYGVCFQAISNIQLFKSYKHVA
jgi:group I intron endonuclease